MLFFEGGGACRVVGWCSSRWVIGGTGSGWLQGVCLHLGSSCGCDQERCTVPLAGAPPPALRAGVLRTHAHPPTQPKAACPQACTQMHICPHTCCKWGVKSRILPELSGMHTNAHLRSAPAASEGRRAGACRSWCRSPAHCHRGSVRSEATRCPVFLQAPAPANYVCVHMCERGCPLYPGSV